MKCDRASSAAFMMLFDFVVGVSGGRTIEIVYFNKSDKVISQY